MTNTENIFDFIDTYANSSDSLYLEAVIEACQKWVAGEKVPSVTKDVSKEDIRKGIQLAVLQGMQKNAQPHHQMTPDSIGMLIGYFVTKLIKDQQEITILDPAVGTGNLLYTVMNSLDVNVEASGVELDELLVRLAAVTAELLEQPVSFLIQDALRPLLIDPVDVVVSDLPIGFYPDDDNGSNYRLMPAEGHAYAHHLFIEQSLNHTKAGGLGLFVIPANLFESEQASQLHQFFKKHVIIRAVIQLPETIFKSKAHEKSILIVQKKTDEKVAIPEVLLAKVPSMTNKQAMASFIQQFDEWVQAD